MAWLLAPLILLSILFRREMRVLALVALQTGWARDLAGDWSVRRASCASETRSEKGKCRTSID